MNPRPASAEEAQCLTLERPSREKASVESFVKVTDYVRKPAIDTPSN